MEQPHESLHIVEQPVQPEPAPKAKEITALYHFLVGMSRKRKHKTFTIADVARIYRHREYTIKNHLRNYWSPYVQPVPNTPNTYLCNSGIRQIRREYFIDRYNLTVWKEVERYVMHTSTPAKNEVAPGQPTQLELPIEPETTVEASEEDTEETQQILPIHLRLLLFWRILIEMLLHLARKDNRNVSEEL
jgi:hypothetical protein